MKFVVVNGSPCGKNVITFTLVVFLQGRQYSSESQALPNATIIDFGNARLLDGRT